MDKAWTFQDGDHGSISQYLELQLFLQSFSSLEGLLTLNVKSLFFSLQKPQRAKEYLLNKLSLGCIFLFSVLKLNKSWYLNMYYPKI